MLQSATELAYFAGILDGEGYVQVKQKDGLAFILNMADISILEWCLQHIGGTLSGSWVQEGNTRPRKMWFLRRIHGLEDIARGILPYLVLKRHEVEIMLALIEYDKTRPPAIPVHRKNPAVTEWRAGRQPFFDAARQALLARKT